MKNISSKLLIIASLFISNITFVSAETTDSQVKQKKHANISLGTGSFASNIKNPTPPEKSKDKVDTRSEEEKAKALEAHNNLYNSFDIIQFR